MAKKEKVVEEVEAIEVESTEDKVLVEILIRLTNSGLSVSKPKDISPLSYLGILEGAKASAIEALNFNREDESRG